MKFFKQTFEHKIAKNPEYIKNLARRELKQKHIGRRLIRALWFAKYNIP